MNRQLPWYAVELREWGKPHILARRFDCPVSVVLAVMQGDEKAYRSLTDGSASRTGRRVFLLPVVFQNVNTVERRKRPRWMSPTMWHRIVSIFDEAKAG